MPNTLRVKRGLAATLPNGASGEPLFTTDTYELYIGKGDGTNQRYQKYIASGTTSQYLRGDGSLETHNLDSLTDVVVSSPSNGQFLKYNGTNWVNSAGGFLTGGATAAGQVGVFDSTTNIVGYTTFTYDTVTDKLSMTNGYVNNTLTVDGQLVIKSESGASAYTRGLKFPDNSYGGTGDIAGLRLHNAGGENIILELYAGNDSLDTINFAVAAGGSTYNDNVTINGNKIWNAGNLPSPLSSTGTINSGEIPIFSNSTTVYSDTALFWDNSLNRLGVGGTSPNAQVGVSTSSGVNAFGYRTSGASYYELVLAYDNTTYGHTFQANRGASTSARNITFLNGSNTISIDESGNMGIGLVVPNAGTSGPGGLGLDIYASTTAALALHNSTSGTGISAGGRIYYNSTNMTVRNLSAGNLTMTADSGNFVVITNGTENVKVEGSTGKVGIGNPASIAEMLTVNGSIQQSAVTSAITKTDANGKIVAAVAGTDYVAPSALSGYVPTSRTLTINGTTYDLSANRSWTVGIIDGGGSAGRVTYWSDADTVTSDGGFIYDSSTKRLGVNTTVPNATIGATAASGYGLLIKNADSNYGGIGMSVDATYGNLINTEKVGTAPARNLTLLNQAGYISLDESGNMGVNILTPNASTSGPGGIGIDIYSSTTAALAFHNSTSGTGSTNGGRIYYNSTNMTIRNLESGNISITADNGNFQVITLGAENIKVEGSTGKVGIGAPASIAEMLTVNGSIQQSAVTSSMLKANASGKIIAAVSNTDFQAPITLTTTGTSGAATFNGTTLNIPQYQAVLTNPVTGSGTNNEIAYFNATGSTIASLSTATYPSLTELSYVKGVTSSIQTQLNGKQNTLTNPVTGTGTSGYHAKFTATGSTIGNSLIYDNGVRAISVGNSSTNSWASPFYVIEGGSYGQFLGYQTNAAAIKLGVNAYFNGSNYIYTNSNLGIAILDLTGDATNASLNYYTAPAGTAGSAATLSPRFIIDSSGNAYFVESLGVGFTTGTINGRIDFRNPGNAIIVGKNTTGGTNTYSSIRLTTANSGGVGDSIGEIRGLSTNVNNRDTALTFLTSEGSAGQTEKMRITSGGNVGINVTPSAWGSTWKAIQINAQASIAAENDFLNLSVNAYNDGTNWKRLATGVATNYYQVSGVHVWRYVGSDSAGTNITWSEAMRITSGGNVLIGTTDNTAAYRLNVSVNGGSSYIGVTNQAGGTGDRYLRIGFGTGATVASIQGTRVNVADDVNLALQPDGGNVGIGVTNPGVRLHVVASGAAVATFASSAANGGWIRFARNTSSIYGYAGSGYELVTGGANTDMALTTELGNLLFATDQGKERMRITSGGNVGIGTSSPDTYSYGGTRKFLTLRATLTNEEPFLQLIANGVGNSLIDFGNATIRRATIIGLDGSHLAFYTNGSNSGTSMTERMRITSGGYLKASNDGTYYGSTGAYHEIRQTTADWSPIITNTNASPFGIFIQYTAASPNGTSNEFLYCRDSGLTIRATIRSNGGLANYQANNTNLSDIRTKKDIVSLESYWDKFKALEIVKFKYNDQTHDDYNIGVIAQQVESVAPEFVDVDGWGETPVDGVPLKSVYTADLHHATIKVLQEAMAKIEVLESELAILKNK